MTHSLSTRSTLVFAMTALVLATALPAAGFAATDDGLWKVDAAKSSVGSGSATLAIERAAGANQATGSFIVVAKGSVYLVKRATAGGGKGVQPADYARMTREGSAVLIGTNARSADTCGFRCQGGLAESRMMLTFKAIQGAGQQISDMLAEAK